MRRLLLVIAILILGAGASAEKLVCEMPQSISPSRGPSSVTERNGIAVMQVDPSQPIEGLAEKGYEVMKFGADEDPWGDPSPVLRDYIFRESGVVTLVKDWDQLQRDMLFLRAQEYTLARLRKKYARQIPEGVLAKLQEKIAIAKRSQGVKN